MTDEQFKKLKKLYAQLVGMNRGIYHDKNPVKLEITKDYDNLVDQIALTVDENLESFKIPESAYDTYGINEKMADGEIVIFKIDKLSAYLEIGFNLNEKIKEVGSLVNVIEDQELRDRCLDLLTASSKFDRVINQATLILEDRIRDKAGISERLQGENLVNKALNQDFSKTVLKTSDEPDEHKGVCDVCRGIMLAFRNPTHHYLTDKFSKEDGLKFCGFVDVLLGIINNAEKLK